jgi:adhesin HecA-like repeat protein
VTGSRIVFGVDFSGAMLRAAPWITRCFAPGAPVTLAHALDLPRIPSFLRSVVDHVDAERAREKATLRLTHWRESAGLPDSELVVRDGRPDAVLRDVAFAFRADLIAIATHAGHRRPWMRLGTMTERLMRAADTSLLIARGAMAGAPKHVLVAVDDVEITGQLLAVSGAIAARSAGTLHAVHVLSNAAYSHMLSAEDAAEPNPTQATLELREAMAAEALRWLQAMWKTAGHQVTLRADVPHGVPSDEILRIASESAADLIVIGRYGIGRMLPAFLGSVLGSVVAGAPCPVLVVAR